MPILTPAYPSMNSSYSTSRQTLEVMQEEMASALERVRACLKKEGTGWEEVFAPTDFAVGHSRYLCVEIFVKGLPEHLVTPNYNGWTGFVESRLRKLIEYLSYLPVCRLRLLPKKFPLMTVGEGEAQNGEGLSYLVGFDIDRNRMQGDQLDLTNKVEAFKVELYGGAFKSKLITEEITHKELRVKISDFASYRQLPDVCFESLGGREAARELHKKLRAQRKAAEKAAAEAAGLQPSNAAHQSSESSTTSAGSKRSAAEVGGGWEESHKLQREESMGNGELIDGVAGRRGGRGRLFHQFAVGERVKGSRVEGSSEYRRWKRKRGRPSGRVNLAQSTVSSPGPRLALLAALHVRGRPTPHQSPRPAAPPTYYGLFFSTLLFSWERWRPEESGNCCACQAACGY